jgi:hypothetical protein
MGTCTGKVGITTDPANGAFLRRVKAFRKCMGQRMDQQGKVV